LRVLDRSSGSRFCLSGLALLLLIGGKPVHAQEPQRIVMGLKFQGNKHIPVTVLASGIATTNSGWFARTVPFRWLGFLGEKRFFNEREFIADVLRIQAIYKYSGFPEVQVDTVVRRSTDAVKITFKITEGRPIVVTRMDVTGIQTITSKSTLTRNLPLRRGQPFNRYLMAASADSIVRRLRNRGYPAVLVFRNFDQNAETREAQVTLEVVPGPLSRIESIRVEGESPIDTSYVRKMIPARPGRLFSQDELGMSQRNLYRTELFQFASVQIDSTPFPPGDSTVPLVARIRPGRGHRARASLGYGTTDCFRGGAGWRARNWSGGGRILDLSGRLSKVGVAAPFDASLQNSICGLLSEDSVGSDKLNYNLTASLEQPGLLGALNTATLSLFADRRSEFKTYLREEIGGSFTFRREGLKRIPLTLSYKLSYGSTEASAANFCAFFSACIAEDVDLLRQKRFLGTMTGSISWPRVNNVLDPSRGYFHTVEGTVSSALLGSAKTQEFVKLIANGAWYRELDRDIVLSWRLRLGTIFAPQVEFTQAQPVNFIPPEERFYGGGPNDVRGFQRNELGPLVYVVETSETNTDSILQRIERDELGVRFSATGGNTLVVGNVELRIPSPILNNRMRIAFFVDAGTVWERGREDVAPANLRVTPGFGFRIGTPLGPARLDIAYNPYERQTGALYRSSLQTGDLVKIADDFTSGNRRNITFQFAIGQPF
jgi:outer membrane protein insertion porin family